MDNSTKEIPSMDFSSQAGLTEKVHKVYKIRWFLLATLCMLNVSNAMIWLTFGPVAYKAAQFYNTSTDAINFLSVIFMITGIPCGVIATWLIDSIGLRISVILGAWLNCIGCILRVVSAIDGISEGAMLPICFVGQTIAAFAQPFVLFAPTKLASLWFPENQRATANMIATISNPIGIMLTNILSPILLPSANDMLFMLAIQCIPAGLSTIMATFGWWSSKPKTPPSGSAETDTEPFCVGFKALFRNKQYWLLAWTVGAGIALFSVLTTLLSQILCPWGYTDTFVGVVCVSVLIGAGVIGSGIAGVIVDKTKRFIEVTKIGFVIAIISLIAFACLQNVKEQWAAIASVCGLFGFFGIPVYPIGNELAVETTYPVGEATSSGIVFMFGQIQGILLILVLSSIGTEFPEDQKNMTACVSEDLGELPVFDMSIPVYVMVAYVGVVCIVYVIFFRTDYKRLNSDDDSSPKSEKPPSYTSAITRSDIVCDERL